MDFDPGMPRKVLAKAWGLDPMLHTDCLISGGPCPKCYEVVMVAFDFFYGHHEDLGDVLEAIFKDFRDEEQEKTP